MAVSVEGLPNLNTSEAVFRQPSDRVEQVNPKNSTLDPLNLDAIEQEFANKYGHAPGVFAPEIFTPEPIPQEIIDSVDMQSGYHQKYLNGLLTFSDNFIRKVGAKQTKALNRIQDVLGPEYAETAKRAGAANQIADQYNSKRLSDHFRNELNRSKLNLRLKKSLHQTDALPKAAGGILNLDAMLNQADIDQETAAFKSYADARELGQKLQLGNLEAQTSFDILKEKFDTNREIQNLQAQQAIDRQDAQEDSALGGLLGTVAGGIFSLF